MKRMKKRGSMEDTIFLGVVLIVLAIIFVFTLSVMEIGNAAYQNTSDFTEMKTQIQTNSDSFPQILDNMYLALYIGGYLAVILLSLRVATEPAYFFVAILFMLVVGVLVPYILNVYHDSVATGIGAELVTQFTIIPLIMANYIQMMLVLILAIMVILYGKSKIGGGQ